MDDLKFLATKWGVAASEAMRRVIERAAKTEKSRESHLSPVEALDRLQQTGGIAPKVALEFKRKIKRERKVSDRGY